MLDNETIRKIEDYCIQKPRSVQEISKHLGKNWRTIDRYVTIIKNEYGTLETRIFREGTRGALKVVYYSAVEKFSGTVFQKELEKEIFKGRKKEDFTPFDIFQFIKNEDKDVRIKKGEDESKTGRLIDFSKLLHTAKKQVLFFSGNLSFVSFDDGEVSLYEEIEELVKRDISIKILCRVDIVGIKNIRKILSLNHKYGKELIKIRDRKHPLRATIIDDKIINVKEIREPTCRDDELQEKIFIYYTIRNRKWVKWLKQIFWKMYNSSISSEKRLSEIEKIGLTY